MKLFSKAIHSVRQASAKKFFLLFALFLTLSVGATVGVGSLTQSDQVDAATSSCGDDSTNSIVRNGANSRAALISKIKASPELKQVYADRGLTSKDYSRFISDAKPGVALRNNTIVVGGDVVATNAGSLGRTKGCQGSGAKTYPVKGFKAVYGNLNSQSMASGTKSLPVDVLFDSQGQVQFAVMTSDCGNPTTQTPVKPTFVCHSLQSKSLGNNSFSFTTDADAGHGASISKVVYDFGDGSATKTEKSPTTAVPHTFTKSSTVTVKVYISLPGGGQTILTNCLKHITFTPPPAVTACDLLTLTPGKVNDSGNTSYTLTAKASATHATIKSYTFTIGDGTSKVTKNTSSMSASITHTYAPGTYNNVSVLVTFLTNTGKTVTKGNDGDCAQKLTVKALNTSLTCDDLKANKGTVNATTGATNYTLTAKATPKNATISAYAFSFGDGATQTKNTSAITATSDTHSYAAGKTYTAKVTVTAKDINGKTLSTAPAKIDCQVTIPVPAPKMPGVTITKHVDNVKKEQVAVGQTFTYELVVTNTGAVDLVNAAVTDTPPAGVTLLTADKGTVSATGNAWNYTIPSLKVGASVTVNITAKVKTFVAGDLVNTACVNAVEVNPTHPAVNDACDTATVTVTPPAPGVTITKHVDNVKTEQVAVGQVFTYELVVTNTGDVDLVNAVVTDTPPTGVTLLTADKGTVSASGNAWTYTVPSLKVGASISISLTAKVPAQVTGDLVNTACVNAVEVNPTHPTVNDACDTATVTLVPVAPKNPNITITKTVDGKKSEQVAVGQSFTYQLVIKNTGEKDLVNAVVTDAAPSGVTLKSADLGTVTSDTAWTYTIPTLAIGDSVTVNITATVDDFVAGALVNTACVNAVEVNPDQPTVNDACDTATVTVTPPAPTTLVNTGTGSVVGIFAATAVLGTVAHRLFLGRRLNRQN